MSSKKKIKDYFLFSKINFVIRILTISDVITISAIGFLTPIFAIFIVDSIEGASIEVAGIAMAVYLLSKSLFQIPFAALVDKIKGERDDFWAMFLGSVLYSLVPLLYIVISTPLELYLVQFVYGVLAASLVPAWMAIFTRHIDKFHEGYEWGVYQTLVDLGSAAAASIGGFLALKYGFNNLFIIVSVFSLIGSLFLALVYKDMRTGNILFNK